MIGPILGMVGSPLVVPFWENFWNLSARGLVATHSVLSPRESSRCGLRTVDLRGGLRVSAAGSAELGTPQWRQQPAIHSSYLIPSVTVCQLLSTGSPNSYSLCATADKTVGVDCCWLRLWQVQDSSNSTRFARQRVQSQTGAANNQMLATAVDPRAPLSARFWSSFRTRCYAVTST